MQSESIESESIFWVWLPVSAVLFRFVLVTTTHGLKVGLSVLRVGLSGVECPESWSE